jgi:hypothetical protein
MDDLDVVSQQLVADDVDLAVDDAPRPQAEILDRDLLLHPVALTETEVASPSQGHASVVRSSA